MEIFSPLHPIRLKKLKWYIKALNPVGYWPLWEQSGTQAKNYAPSTMGTLDGTTTGATIGQTGQAGKAYSFDGTNDKITISDNSLLEGMATVSIQFIAKIPDTAVARKIFFKNGVFDFGINGGGQIFGELNGIGNPGTWDDTVVDDDIWRIYHVTYDGATMRMYINGSEIENLGSLSGSVATSGDDLLLGVNAGADEWHKGLTQHIALFDKALTAGQILKLAQKAGVA